MKRALIMAAMLLAGCQKVPDSAQAVATPTTQSQTTDDENAVTYWQDEKTSCWYIVWQSKMTAELMPNGRPRCGDQQ